MNTFQEVQKTFISMEEARNGDHFIDQTSALGLQDAALWKLSCVSGGRRPRTYAAIRLCDLTKVATEQVTDGVGRNVATVGLGSF